jgi:parvulin-like peptidyl-prolyl isomerase
MRPNAIFPEIVAKIGGKPVYGRDLELIVRQKLETIGSPKWKDLKEEIRSNLTKAAMDMLIESKLIFQKALSAGIKATDEAVQAELQEISKLYRSEAEMNADLAGEGMNRALLQKSIYEKLTVKKYLQETIEKKISVTSEEITNFYKENPDKLNHGDLAKISQIVLLAGETSEQDAAAKRSAEDILARVKKNPDDFAKFAKENSVDISASKGGDVGGYIDKDKLEKDAPEFTRAIFSLAVGEVKLVKLESNYRIIKVTDKKKKGIYTLEEVKSQIEEHLKDIKYDAELNKLINRLKDETKPQYLIPYMTLKP